MAHTPVDSPTNLAPCLERQRLLEAYAKLQFEVTLNDLRRDRIATANAWLALKAHLTAHGC